MQEKTKEPEIRFAGFTGAWEQRELGEISEIKTGPFGSSLHASDYVADGVPIITTEHFKFGSIEKNKYLIPMVPDTDHSRLIAYSLKTGDIVFSRVGSVDINALVEPESDGWLFSGRVLRVRSSEKYDSGFLHNLLETDDVRNDIRNRAVGQTMPSINTQILSATELTIPSSKREQQRIGNFFKGINQLLPLHQRKYEKLLNIKKSMLEKMFPKEGEVVPEIRFKGFTGAWEQRKLREIATFINGRAYSQNELLSAGKYRVLRVGNFYTNDSWYYSNLELADKYYALNGDLLYTWSATFGPHIWTGNKVIYHYHIWKVELSESLEKYFAVQLLERDKNKIVNDKNGSTMVHVTKSGMENEEVVIPFSVLEQQKIGNFFKKLDSLLTLHQRQQNGGYLWLENSAKQVCFAIITASGYRSTKKALSDQLR